MRQTKCECKCICNAPSLNNKPMNAEMCCHDLASKKSSHVRYNYVMTMLTEKNEETRKQFESDETIPEHARQLYKQTLPQLQKAQQRHRLASILVDYADCFARHRDDMGRTRMILHEIETGDAKPVRQRCRQLAIS